MSGRWVVTRRRLARSPAETARPRGAAGLNRGGFAGILSMGPPLQRRRAIRTATTGHRQHVGHPAQMSVGGRGTRMGGVGKSLSPFPRVHRRAPAAEQGRVAAAAAAMVSVAGYARRVRTAGRQQEERHRVRAGTAGGALRIAAEWTRGSLRIGAPAVSPRRRRFRATRTTSGRRHPSHHHGLTAL